MKNWFYLLLLLPPLLAAQPAQQDGAVVGGEAAEPSGEMEEEANWVDGTHAAVTDRAQALTQWMDNFFGDPEYDLEKAESQLRLKFINDWESEDGNQFSVRVRGKVQVPKISRRLDIVFSEERSDLDGEDELSDNDDGIALQYNLEETKKSRYDLTLGWSSGPKPGVKYRYQGSFDESNSYRFIERVQYEIDDGFISKSELDLNHALNSNNVLQWSNRVFYGESTDGVEWRSRVALRQRINPDSDSPTALNYIASVNGITSPQSFIKNYRLAVLWRKRVYRDYMFLELEPGYNFRKRNNADDRDDVFSMTVRIEIALERDLRKRTRKAKEVAYDDEDYLSRTY